MKSHGKAVHFANKKKIRYSGTKCFVMVMDVKENAEICVQNAFILKDWLILSKNTFAQFSEVISNGDIRCFIFGQPR